MMTLQLKNMNEGTAKEFLKLDIHRAVITAIHHNSGPHNATVPVPQVGKSPGFARENFISPLLTPNFAAHKSY